MTPENRSIIEKWWLTHGLNDTGWLALAKPEPCRHRDIGVVSFGLWKCSDCGKVVKYEDFR